MVRTDRLFRIALIIASVALIVLTAGLLWQLPWAIVIWPWPDGRLSYAFIASILAAISIAAMWIGYSGEIGATTAGALNMLVIAAGMTLYLSMLMMSNDRRELWVYVLVAAIVALASFGLAWWSHRVPIRDPRLTPRPVLIAFGLFALMLIAAGTSLVLGVPVIFPWPLKPESSVMFGLIFIGDAFYFLHALFIRRWHNAKGQLLSFLAYDLVLLPVFLPHLAKVQPAHRLSLIIYLTVLIGSCLLALYYLAFNPYTRFGRWNR